MNVIGISGLANSFPFKKRKMPGLSAREYYVGQGFDAAAALVTEQGILAAAAEERFTGEKATGAFPVNAIRYCLKAGNLLEQDIDYVAHGFSYEPHRAVFQNDPFAKAQYDEVFSPEAQKKLIETHFPNSGWAERFVPVSHHLAHAASAFYPSEFDEALILISDGMGEIHSATVAVGQANDIKILAEIPAFHSLGMLYGVFSLHLGFYMNSDEYKVMGLAPYGNPRRFFNQMMALVSLRNDGTYTIPAFAQNRTLEERETHRGILKYLAEQFGPPREPESEITQTHKDLAAGLQALLQTCQLHVLRHFKRQTGQRNLCLAGGVALNCSTNGVIKRSDLFDRVFVQPASGDDGTCLGAALWVQRQHSPHFKRPANAVPLWGPEFSGVEISNVLNCRKDCRIVETESDETLCREVAAHLNRGKIVAWFEGRMEFGPRALGSRSILADPRDPTMRDRINALVKKREAFRPFAPVVTSEAAAGIFEIRPGEEGTYAHMLFVTHVRPEYRSRLPATTHIDGSARVQTVSQEQNPKLWKLLDEFAALSGVPVLLNTSFNVRGQPIVCTPQEAIDTFLAARLDMLVLGKYLVFPAAAEAAGQPVPEGESTLEELQQSIDRHEEFWVNRLADLDPLVLPYKRSELSKSDSGQPGVLKESYGQIIDRLSATMGGGKVKEKECLWIALFASFLARLSRSENFHVGFTDKKLRNEIKNHENLFASLLPLQVSLGTGDTFGEAASAIRNELERLASHKTFALELPKRHPGLHALNGQIPNLPVAVCLGGWNERDPLPTGTDLLLSVAEDSDEVTWVYEPKALDAQTVNGIAAQFRTFSAKLAESPGQSIQRLPLLDPAERHKILVDWNDTHGKSAPRFCIHEAFERQVKTTPDAIALVFEDQQLTYRELDERASVLATRLQQLKVAPDTLVGVCLDVSLDMMVALMGVLKAGGAYVPLDPGYPKERIGFMISDANLPVVITDTSLAGLVPESLQSASEANSNLPRWNGTVLCLDDESSSIAVNGNGTHSHDTNGNSVTPETVTPENLAYVIYTSGSTGKPKGVMINHGNVANFFMAMDERLGTDPGVWLAVTSICFDISVLELFWTLSRGYKVVLQRREQRAAGLRVKPVASTSLSARSTSAPSRSMLDFSLFYFAADETGNGRDKYRLLLEGAKFADTHGFTAVWTPERHFHAFGGLYPNPSITSAALAVMTQRIKIRAGSVVLPLHHPVRVAEEWAVVDNLSHGRVAISFASGWQINDFVLAPENHARRKELMLEHIETVKKLWRGESIQFPNPKGVQTAVKILPRPVQRELPIWITASGNPETYELAGTVGANVLTHLLGQNIAELGAKIQMYRDSWRKAGHGGEGQVTLMLHTFVGEDLEQVRDIVREPFTSYLKTSIDLIKNDPWAFSTFKRPAAGNGTGNGNGSHQFTQEEVDAIARHAFDRHFSTSGLFGTPRDCLSLIEQIRAAGVNEVACLIDFGVEPETVLANLKHLNELRELATHSLDYNRVHYSIAAQMRAHSVTHLQCTPSMAAMLAEDPETLAALRSLKMLLLGGEALPGALIDQLQFRGEILNMYGPTETTIWSATHRVDSAPAIVPIGRPIANTDIYIVDQQLEPQPVGVPGEILIGGAGVVRGYLNRPELTAERFIANPFKPGSGERVYRTGDLGRFAPDGTIEFLGRLDHQVKVRGFRIELGEIEGVLRAHATVKDCVCIVREDKPGDKRLIAYIVPADGMTVSVRDLREHAQSKLPDYMVPAAYVPLATLPLTPNGKIDRKALPRPVAQTQALEATAEMTTPQETRVLQAIHEVLGTSEAALEANFFELGGNSLLATQLIGRLRETFEQELPLRLAFEYPTARSLARAIAEQAELAGFDSAPNHLAARGSAPEKSLSFAQQRIWFLHQLEPGSHYNDRFDLRIEGPLDAEVLGRAINEIVHRHDTLRASFEKVDGNPVQHIAPDLRIGIPAVDLSHLRSLEAEREAEKLAIGECNKAFDLERGPLLRVLLIKLAKEHHILVLTFDHIIIDGWSHGVFLSELIVLYEAFVEDKPSPLPALPMQYADYARWQAALLEGEATKRHLQYWRQQLAGAPPLLALPADRPRPAVPSYRGAREPVLIERGTISRLSSLGRQDGCTLFMVLLGAFQSLLGRYAESEDVLIGSPIANRNHTEIEGLIGSFMNTLVLRGDLRGDPTFRELLRRTRTVALDAYMHQDLPFEKLVAELQPSRNLSYSPLFQVMFILQNTPMPEYHAGPLKFSSYEIDAGSSKLDLTLNLEETNNGCTGWIEYSSDLFERSTITQMIAAFQALLANIIEQPERHLSELTSAVNQPRRVGEPAIRPVSPPEVPALGQDNSRVELTPSRRGDLPATSVEKELARIWTEVLGVGEIGLNDNLFDLGGHSLLVTRIISRIRQALDVEVAIHAFFETPTLGAIAAIIEGEQRKARPASH